MLRDGRAWGRGIVLVEWPPTVIHSHVLHQHLNIPFRPPPRRTSNSAENRPVAIFIRKGPSVPARVRFPAASGFEACPWSLGFQAGLGVASKVLLSYSVIFPKEWYSIKSQKSVSVGYLLYPCFHEDGCFVVRGEGYSTFHIRMHGRVRRKMQIFHFGLV